MEWEVNVPKWENEGTEPSDELIQNGFSAGYKPPANIFNWFWNRVTDAIREIHVKLYNENYDRIAMDGVLQENIDKKADLSSFLGHVSNRQNPHGVTKEQVELGNVDNTADLNKPVSTAMQTALNGKADKTDLVKYDNAVNLIPYPYNYTEYTHNGVAVKGNYGDGRITFNGTTTASIFSEYYNNSSKPLTGNLYYIVKNYTGNSLRCEAYNGQSWLADFSITDGTVKKITNATKISIYTKKVGETFNNVEIYPVMIAEDEFVNNNIYNIMRMQTALNGKADKTEIYNALNNNGISSKNGIQFANGAGWYRVAKTTGNISSTSGCIFTFGKGYNGNQSQRFNILVDYVFGNVRLTQLSNTVVNFNWGQPVPKVRLVYPTAKQGAVAYLEVYYADTGYEWINFDLTGFSGTDKPFTTMFEYYGSDTLPTGYSSKTLELTNSELAQKEVVLWSGNLSLSTAHTISLNDTTDNYDYLILDFAVDNQMYCPSIKLPCKDVPNESYYEFDGWSPTNTFTVSRNGNSLYISNSGNQGKIWKIRGEI